MFFLPTFIHYTGTKPILATGYMHSKSTFTRNTQLLKTSVFMQKKHVTVRKRWNGCEI